MTPLSGRKILVLGRDDRAALAVVRSLGRAGAEVHVAQCTPKDPPARSIYCFEHHRLPPIDDAPRWIDALAALIQRQRFALVVPVSDDRIILRIRRHAEKLEGISPIYRLNERAFDYSYDKAKTLQMADELGIHVPDFIILDKDDCLPEEVFQWKFPLVCRPASSFDLQNPGAEKWTARFVHSRAALMDTVRMMTRKSCVIVQKPIIGQGAGVAVLGYRGECLAMFQHLRIHEAPTGSGSSLRRSTPLHPEMAEATRKIAQFTRLTGVLMVEFKCNVQTNRWHLIEINGRFWGSLPLAVAAGADFPSWLAEMILSGRTTFAQRHDTSLYARNRTKDLRWYVRNLFADKTDPYLITRPLAAATKEVFDTGSREVSDCSAPDDPSPGRRLLLRYCFQLYDLVSRAIQRSPLARKRSQHRALRRWHNAERILFLCHGNIYRSPFAEFAARRHCPDKCIASAGFYRQAGRSSPELALQAANEMSISLHNHRSRTVARELVDKADLIVVFDGRNMVNLRMLNRPAVRKAIFLGALASRGPLSIADPNNGSLKTVRRCYAEIARTLARVSRTQAEESRQEAKTQIPKDVVAQSSSSLRP